MKAHVLTIALALLSVNCLHAQQSERTFTARVVDRTNHDPIPFATVKMEGTTRSAVTDMDGLFSFPLFVGRRSERRHITVNYMGYHPIRYRVPRSDKGRPRIIKLRRVKFDFGDPPVIRYDMKGAPPFIEK